MLRDSYPIRQAPEYLLEKYGQKFSESALHRWIHAGLRGTKLKTTYVGGRVHITPAAFESFFAAVSAARAKA